MDLVRTRAGLASGADEVNSIGVRANLAGVTNQVPGRQLALGCGPSLVMGLPELVLTPALPPQRRVVLMLTDFGGASRWMRRPAGLIQAKSSFTATMRYLLTRALPREILSGWQWFRMR